MAITNFYICIWMIIHFYYFSLILLTLKHLSVFIIHNFWSLESFSLHRYKLHKRLKQSVVLKKPFADWIFCNFKGIVVKINIIC